MQIRTPGRVQLMCQPENHLSQYKAADRMGKNLPDMVREVVNDKPPLIVE